MEDRLTPWLYLEPSQLAAGEYASRAVDVLARPGVSRATWWTNAHLGRRDLPRVVPEFPTLGVYEIESDPLGAAPTTPSARPNDGGGWLFRRTARPGQGVLTGEPTTGLLLVLISPKRAEDAQALRDWADFVHIRHIAAAAVPGYGMITPYENAAPLASEDPPDNDAPRFLHLYEIHGPDAEAVFRTMTPLVLARLGEPGTPAFDEWAGHPALRIMYVNTFNLVGEKARG